MAEAAAAAVVYGSGSSCVCWLAPEWRERRRRGKKNKGGREERREEEGVDLFTSLLKLSRSSSTASIFLSRSLSHSLSLFLTRSFFLPLFHTHRHAGALSLSLSLSQWRASDPGGSALYALATDIHGGALTDALWDERSSSSSGGAASVSVSLRLSLTHTHTRARATVAIPILQRSAHSKTREHGTAIRNRESLFLL